MDGSRPAPSTLRWPKPWPTCTVREQGRNLHHGWNGLDGRDPERTQTLPHDPSPLGPLGRWLRQLANSHHVAAARWLNAWMAIPAARLPEASGRLAAVLAAHGWPLPARFSSYGAALRGLEPDRQAHHVL